MNFDNLNSDPIAELFRRVRALETASPMDDSSMTRGRFRVGGQAILLVDSEGGIVIEGRLTGDGKFEWTGPATFTGTLDVNGNTKLRGLLELLADLRVKAGAKITVEGASPIVLSQVAGAAQMQLGDARLVGGTNGYALGVGNRVFYSTLSGVVAQGGANEVAVDASTGTTVTGPFKATNATVSLTGLPTTPAAGKTPNIWVDGNGRLWRLI